MKKIISVVLVAIMLAAMFVPMNVSAAASVAWTNTSELWNWDQNNGLFAEKATTAPNIDGLNTDAVWGAAIPLELRRAVGAEKVVDSAISEGSDADIYFAWDSEYLYIFEDNRSIISGTSPLGKVGYNIIFEQEWDGKDTLNDGTLIRFWPDKTTMTNNTSWMGGEITSNITFRNLQYQDNDLTATNMKKGINTFTNDGHGDGVDGVNATALANVKAYVTVVRDPGTGAVTSYTMEARLPWNLLGDHLAGERNFGIKVGNTGYHIGGTESLSWNGGTMNWDCLGHDPVQLAGNGTDSWDGETEDTSWFDAGQTTHTIDTAEELAGLVKLANEQANNGLADHTFEITSHMALGSAEWKEMDNFAGTLVGKFGGADAPVTIYSMSLAETAADVDVAMIKNLSGTVKNITFEKPAVASSSSATKAVAVVAANTAAGAVIEDVVLVNPMVVSVGTTGVVVGNAAADLTIKDVAATRVNVMGGANVGGIVGNATAALTFTNVYVDGQIVAAGSNVGGVVGQAAGNVAMTDVQANARVYYGGTDAASVSGYGIVIGKAGANVTLTKCVATGVALVNKSCTWIGAATGTVAADKCYANSNFAISGTTKATALDSTKILGDAAKDNMTDLDWTATWVARADKIPVLAVAGSKIDAVYSNADLTWFDPAGTAFEIKNKNQLYGLGMLSYVITVNDYKITFANQMNQEMYLLEGSVFSEEYPDAWKAWNKAQNQTSGGGSGSGGSSNKNNKDDDDDTTTNNNSTNDTTKTPETSTPAEEGGNNTIMIIIIAAAAVVVVAGVVVLLILLKKKKAKAVDAGEVVADAEEAAEEAEAEAKEATDEASDETDAE